MPQTSRQQYLESTILTASQPKLHSMLLDGAIRYGHQAQELWAEDADFDQIDALLGRMCDIVDELTHGTSTSGEALGQEFAEQYAFVYRELIASRFNEDPRKLQSCLSLLEYQRETWRLARERIAAEVPANPANPVLPHMQPAPGIPPAGFSCEA